MCVYININIYITFIYFSPHTILLSTCRGQVKLSSNNCSTFKSVTVLNNGKQFYCTSNAGKSIQWHILCVYPSWTCISLLRSRTTSGRGGRIPPNVHQQVGSLHHFLSVLFALIIATEHEIRSSLRLCIYMCTGCLGAVSIYCWSS